MISPGSNNQIDQVTAAAGAVSRAVVPGLNCHGTWTDFTGPEPEHRSAGLAGKYIGLVIDSLMFVALAVVAVHAEPIQIDRPFHAGQVRRLSDVPPGDQTVPTVGVAPCAQPSGSLSDAIVEHQHHVVVLVTVLSNPDVSHLGRFAVDEQFSSLGAFKTPTLRNIALTAPYMHDGSLATLRDVVVHYNNGGVIDEGDPINPFLSGGIRPLNLTEDQIDDLVAFMEALNHFF